MNRLYVIRRDAATLVLLAICTGALSATYLTISRQKTDLERRVESLETFKVATQAFMASYLSNDPDLTISEPAKKLLKQLEEQEKPHARN